ncbi:hypothetical protein [Macrococcus epidermidis]|uniref:hypothetical protein n=1 Tax=Macrococcus epidermidis TaxID=1902580 RepID=UPI0020B7AA13|nr:hypothetical protein [Macrococcus epidermidis]UTH15457.1 hypothetical protein KFV12_09020 [Macrococcus epidermidis]
MIETSVGIEWGTLLFTLVSFLMLIGITSILIYFSRRYKKINKLERRIQDLEKRDKRNDL